jgi:hypothetical protein
MTLTPDDIAQIQAMVAAAPTVGEGFAQPIVAGENLLIPAIQSPNYVPGVSGWAIFQNGSAQFNNIALGGGSLVVTGAGQGVFLYSGTPATGNLIASFASSGGSDAHSNAYVKGLGFYDSTGPIIEIRPDLHALLVYQG